MKKGNNNKKKSFIRKRERKNAEDYTHCMRWIRNNFKANFADSYENASLAHI